MTTIVNGNSVVPVAPGAIVQILAPPTYIQGVPSDVIGVTGTASWGPVNSPVLVGSPAAVINSFGGITSAALTDIHDLCTDLIIAFTQAQSTATLQAYGVRVTDGTDVKATGTVKDTAAAVGATITATYSGVLGNSITISVATGAKPSTFDVTLTGFAGSQTEFYPGLPASGTTFWPALVSAINNGLQNYRGPSLLVKATIGTSSVAPAVQSVTLTGGTDGRTVTSVELVGSNTSAPYTGLYSLAGLIPQVGIIWAAGLSDVTVAPTVAAIAELLPAWGLFSAPAGAASNVATLISTLQATSVADYHVSFCGNWIYWYDPVNGQIRQVAPYAFIGGTTATLPPEESPLNTAVSGVVGTERNNPYATPQPFSQAELGALDKAGVLVITTPSPGGSYYGIQSGRNTAPNPAQEPVEYTRLTNYLALSLGNVIGQFIGMNQSQQLADPLRNQVQHLLDTFTNSLVQAGRISSAYNNCSFAQSGSPQAGINTPASISQHYLYALSQLQYLSSVWYFVLSLQGGTTVVTVGSAAGAGQPGA